jgi:hypothetical protein
MVLRRHVQLGLARKKDKWSWDCKNTNTYIKKRFQHKNKIKKTCTRGTKKYPFKQ